MTVAAAASGGHRCRSCGGGRCVTNVYVNNNVQGVTNSVLVGSKVVMRDPGARVTASRRRPRRGRRREAKANGTGIAAGVVLLCVAASVAAVFCLDLLVRVRNLH